MPDVAGSDDAARGGDTSGCQSLQLWCRPLTVPRSQVRGTSRTSPHGDRRTLEHLVGSGQEEVVRSLPAHHGASACARRCACRRQRRRGRCRLHLPPRPEFEATGSGGGGEKGGRGVAAEGGGGRFLTVFHAPRL